MSSTHAHFKLSAREIGAKLKPHGSVCPPFLDTQGRLIWRPVVSILIGDSIVFSVHTRKQRFQKASSSNRSTLESVFDDRFRRCSVDDSLIRSKPAPFSFENGLAWTGPELAYVMPDAHQKKVINFTTTYHLRAGFREMASKNISESVNRKRLRKHL